MKEYWVIDGSEPWKRSGHHHDLTLRTQEGQQALERFLNEEGKRGWCLKELIYDSGTATIYSIVLEREI